MKAPQETLDLTATQENTIETTTESGLTTPSEFAPTDDSHRLGVLDSLRGVALIGILMMNIEWFGRSIGELGTFDKNLTGIDHAAGWFVRFFVEGKFYKLFALLFGMGFAIMLIKAQRAGRPFGWWFTRRMLALYLFGVLHLVFLWTGDILHDYALGGLLMLGWIYLFRSKRFSRYSLKQASLKTALWLLVMPIIVTIVVAFGYGASHSQTTQKSDIAEYRQVYEKAEKALAQLEISSVAPARDKKTTQTIQITATGDSIDESSNGDNEKSIGADTSNNPPKEEPDLDKMTPDERILYLTDKRVEQLKKRDKRKHDEVKAMTSPQYGDLVRYNWQQTPSHLGRSIFFSLFMLVPIFMLGYWLIATEKLTHLAQNKLFFKSLAIVGLTTGFAMTGAGLLLLNYPDPNHSRLISGVGNTLFNFAQYAVAAGYLGTFVLLWQRSKWQKFLNLFSPLGKMALTNYISHTVILSFLFFGYGAGLYGTLGRATQMLVVVAIIVTQIIFCRIWLHYFQFGPLEWLWRSITYWKLQPMRKQPI